MTEGSAVIKVRTFSAAGENGETIGLIRSVVYRTHDD